MQRAKENLGRKLLLINIFREIWECISCIEKREQSVTEKAHPCDKRELLKIKNRIDKIKNSVEGVKNEVEKNSQKVEQKAKRGKLEKEENKIIGSM